MIYAATGPLGFDALTITTGVKIPFIWDANTPGCTLTSTTYYFPFGTERAGVANETADISLQMKWAAAVTGTATIEVCNYPATLSQSGQGGAVATDFDSGTPGFWSLLDPTLAGPVYAVAAGGGNSMTKYTLTLGGTNAGVAAWNIPDFGWRRGRIKLALSVGGVVWVSGFGKLGA